MTRKIALEDSDDAARFIETAPLSEVEREAICFRNAERVLRLGRPRTAGPRCPAIMRAINSGSGSQNAYARGEPIAAIQEPTKPDWVRVTSGVAKVSKRDTGFRASAFDFFATLEARFRRNSRLAPGSIRPFGPATQP